MTNRQQFSRSLARATVLSLLFCAGFSGSSAAKDRGELRVIVLDEAGDPVSRASVILSRVKKVKGDKVKVKGESMQMKTSLEGSAPLPPLPQGDYLLQVISSGYQTYDDLVALTEPEQTVSVTLSPPQNQFSVHKKP